MNELEQIVQRMIDAGESEENIAAVIKEYNTVKMNPNAQGAAAGGEQAPNTDSNLGNGSLVFEPPKYEQQYKTYIEGKEKN